VSDPSAGCCPCCDAGAYAASADWPADVSRRLYEQLAEIGFAGRTVLEIGCGYGRLLVGALLAGASSATGVELDDDALDETRKRAEEAGVGDRISLIEGDGAVVELARHDMVVLDRVICCYDDVDRLVDQATRAAGSIVAMTVPESRGPAGSRNRIVYAVGAILDRIRGEEPVYLHDIRRIESRLAAAGFRTARGERTGKWYVGVHVRGVSG